MKKIHLITFGLFACTFLFNTTRAQGWDQSRTGIYSVGIGGTDVIGLGTGYPALYGSGTSLNFSGEYRVQRFIGVGFQTGLDVFFGPTYYRPNIGPYPSYTAVGIPVGAKVNIHILEAANAPIANVLDVYAGLNLGGGPAFYTGPMGPAPAPVDRAFLFLYGGPQVGIRYWFNSSIAIFGEFGWGATYANIGLTF